MSVEVKYMSAARMLIELSASIISNVKFLFSRIPGTPLRVLGMTWLEFNCRSQNCKVNGNSRTKSAALIYYHAVLNRYFDGKQIHLFEILKARRILRQANIDIAYCQHYLERLRQIESSRAKISFKPFFVRDLRLVRIYREQQLSLAHDAICQIYGASLSPQTRDANIAMMSLIQYVDDAFDIAIDTVLLLPSYCSHYSVLTSKQIARHRRSSLNHYLQRARKNESWLCHCLLIAASRFCVILILLHLKLKSSVPH